MSELMDAFQEFKDAHTERIKQLDARHDSLEAALNRQGIIGPSQEESTGQLPLGRFSTTVKGQKIQVLAKGDRLAASYPRHPENDWSVADFVRGSMGLDVKDSVLERGVATVPTNVSAEIIDLIRAKARVIQAGALTIPIEGPSNLCRIDGEPTVHQHTEGQEDISESIPSLSPVEVNPKGLVALIPLSMELVSDSPNLDAALNIAIAGAFAGKLDTLALATLLADANIPDSVAGQATNTWAGIMAGVGSMMGLDMDVPTALICNPADYISRAGELSDTGGNWLGAPPILANMLDLPTTTMTAGYALLGDFAKGVGVAVRQELRLEVVRWAKSTTASHLLVAHARMQAYTLQPNALYRQLATVV